jgi:hypothetical protein
MLCYDKYLFFFFKQNILKLKFKEAPPPYSSKFIKKPQDPLLSHKYKGHILELN